MKFAARMGMRAQADRFPSRLAQQALLLIVAQRVKNAITRIAQAWHDVTVRV